MSVTTGKREVLRNGPPEPGPVLILGCGPAGLLAAYAVEQMGGSPAIMSRKVKSTLPGAQYLHEPIPGLTREPDGIIKTIWEGTAEGYASKVYGSPDAPTSWRASSESHHAWSLRRIYDELWAKYSPQVVETEINRSDLAEFVRMFPLVISTIWAPALCAPEWRRPMENIKHNFDYQSMYVGDFAAHEACWDDNVVLYNGSPDVPWYRTSRVFGFEQTEFSAASMLDAGLGYAEEGQPSRGHELRKGIKVVGTNCDCFPEIKRAGRYGTWRKGYLAHQAYADAINHYTEAFGAG